MWKKGCKLTIEHKAKIGFAFRGKRKSPEHRAKLVAHLDAMRKNGITPSDFGGKRHSFPKGYIPWNIGLPNNPGLAKIRKLPHGMLGKHHTEQTKLKISQSSKGTSRNSGINNPFYGKIHSSELIENKRKRWQGRGNPCYRDGNYPEPYPLIFNNEIKRKIRKRDSYICQLCGEIERVKAHCIHHIDYNKNNNVDCNLITLCVRCNSRVNIYRDKWCDYFIALLMLRGILNAS